MKKIREIQKTDGFVLFDCGFGACPEIKQSGDEFIIRSSRNPISEVLFTRDEFDTLKEVLERYL